MRNLYFLLLLISLLLSSCSKDDDSPVDGKPDSEEMPDTDPEVVELTGFTPCENGIAGIYPCDGYDFLGRIPISDFEGNAGNDIWGWTDGMLRERNMP